jgi:hypothetical protein
MSGGHMTFGVYLVYEGHARELSSEFDSLEKAVSHGLRMADLFGQPVANDGHAPPKTVEVYSGKRLELSIKVTPGGLLGRKGKPRLRSI